MSGEARRRGRGFSFAGRQGVASRPLERRGASSGGLIGRSKDSTKPDGMQRQSLKRSEYWRFARRCSVPTIPILRASRCEAPDRARSPLRTRSPLFVVPRPSASSVSLSEFSSCSREGQPFPKGPRQTLEGGGAGRPRQRAGFGGESGREMLGASSPAVLPLPADCGIPGVRRAITGANLSIDGSWTEA